jgi:hypothetical protein
MLTANAARATARNLIRLFILSSFVRPDAILGELGQYLILRHMSLMPVEFFRDLPSCIYLVSLTPCSLKVLRISALG